MLRFLTHALLGVPGWLAYTVLMLPLILIGFPLVAVLATVMQLRSKYHSYDKAGLSRFPTVFGLRLFYLWDNDEDGVDGDPLPDGVGGLPKNEAWFEETQRWSTWRRVFVWSAWRNSVGNARRLPFFGMDMPDPKDTVVHVPAFIKLQAAQTRLETWKEYRKLGPYLARYGYRFELRFPWPRAPQRDAGGDALGMLQPPRYFWIGWRIAQQDTPNTDIGFAFQPWAKL